MSIYFLAMTNLDELNGTWTFLFELNGSTSLDEIKGTWEKGDISLIFTDTKLSISGASWTEINETFDFEVIEGQSGSNGLFIYFDPYGMSCKIMGEYLFIPSGSGPSELHGLWTSNP
jgi:hypothetical protein